MSDTSQGPGWWKASDGKWYPPESAATPLAPAPAPPVGGGVPPGPGYWRATDGNWYPPQAPPGVAVKKFYTRVWFWLLVIVALGIGGCVTVISVATVAVNKANTTVHAVVYSVTGSGTADITYDAFSHGNSGSSQNNNVTLPWTKTVTGSGIFALYSVDGTLSSGGTVTCTITVDGKQVATNTSTGQFASAVCTASAP